MYGLFKWAQGKGTRRRDGEGCRYGIYFISVEIDSTVQMAIMNRFSCRRNWYLSNRHLLYSG